MMTEPEAILLLRCADRPGIVAAVSNYLFEHGCNILDSQQFGDRETNQFFMRVHFALSGVVLDTLRAHFAPVVTRFGLIWSIHDCAARPKVLILVSRHAHCLNDLLFRWKTHHLNIEVTGVVSNHTDLA